MSQPSSLTSCKLYSLRRSTVFDAQFDKNIAASEIAAYVTSAILAELNETTRTVPNARLDPIVVLLPSTTSMGKIFTADDKPILYALTHGIDLWQTPLCLFHQPALVRVSPADSKQDARQIVLDLAAPLVAHIPLLQSVFNMSTSEFSFRAIFPTYDTWLHSQMSLMEHRLDYNVAFLELVHMKTIISRWKEIVVGGDVWRPERVGYLYKQEGGTKKESRIISSNALKTKSRRQTESQITTTSATSGLSVNGDEAARFKSLRKKSKRWFVLKGLFLGCFKTRDDALPSVVIPLDYYIVRLSDEFKKGERVMSLYKYVPSFPKGLLGDFVLGAELENENELRLWFQSTNGKCANTALNRVFGMPLLHQLCHNQYGYIKKPALSLEDPLFYVPPFLTQCVKYLSSDGIDHEGIFRVSHVTSEVLAYRELFDTGMEINLRGANPHCIASLIKAWLRELPEPLIPHNMYSAFLQAVTDTKDKELKVERVFHLAETNLPLHSLRTLSYLATFMKLIVSYNALNKMSFSALAIVLGPCVMRGPMDGMLREEDDEEEEDEVQQYNPLLLLKEVPQINEVVQLLFENSERLANVVEQVATRLASDSSPPSPNTNLTSDLPSPSSSQHQKLDSRQQYSLKLPNQGTSKASDGTTNGKPSPAPAAPQAPHTTKLPSSNGNAAHENGVDENMAKSPLSIDLSEVKKQQRRRSSSTKVIHSLTEELPPLKEGQITIFTPSGATPTVTIEPSPRSLRMASPKWGKKVRNPSQWKGGMVGADRKSGSTSPVPPTDSSSDASSSKRLSDEQSVHLAPERKSPRMSFSQSHDSVIGYTSHSADNLGVGSSERLSPRSTWNQPVSPDPEARLLSMIMAMQSSHELLYARVSELEERLSKEVAHRTAIELKMISMMERLEQ